MILISYTKKIIINSVGMFIYLVVYLLRFFDVYCFRYPNAFGHQALNVEFYARKVKIIAKTDSPTIIAIRHYEKERTVANYSLFKHHKYSDIKVVSNRIMCFLLDIGLTFQKEKIEKNGGKKSVSFLTLTLADLNTDPDIHILSDVALPFDKRQTDVFRSILNKMFLKDRGYYIVLDRGDDYGCLKAAMNRVRDDIVEHAYTNQHSPFEVQFKAAKEMKRYNLSAVKMGGKSRKKVIDNKLILDYPSKFRSSMGDIADLALMNHCKFYVGPTSGVYGFAQSLKKPILLCNVFPWPWHNVTMGSTSIVMPKKFWLIKEKRMATLLEMIKLEGNYSMKDVLFNKKILEGMSIELVSNTEDEIADSVKEINSRIDGKWNGDNYSLSSVLKGYIGEVSQSYLSTSFAEKNPDIMIGINPDD